MLTPREREVFELRATLNQSEIAERLGVSRSAVRKRLRSACTKLDVPETIFDGRARRRDRAHRHRYGSALPRGLGGERIDPAILELASAIDWSAIVRNYERKAA